MVAVNTQGAIDFEEEVVPSAVRNWRGDRKPSLAIIGPSRTGSTSLSAFMRLRGWTMEHEPFHPENGVTRYMTVPKAVEWLFLTRDSFKHVFDHLQLDENMLLINELMRSHVNILFLDRADRLRQALSWLVAQETQFWHVDPTIRQDWNNFPHYGAYDPKLVEETIKMFVHNATSLRRPLEEYSNAYFANYEKLFHPKTSLGELNRILSWADPDQEQVHDADPSYQMYFGPSRKQCGKSVYEKILNIDEINAHFNDELI